MIQTNKYSDTISGFFGVDDARKDELFDEFRKLFDTQWKKIVDDYNQRANKDDPTYSIDNTQIIDEFLNFAKTPEEQIFCTFYGARQIEVYKIRMLRSAQNYLSIGILRNL